MKIRTDFVTNSSSSSFTIISVNTCDGRKFDMDFGEMRWEDYNMCRIENGELKYSYYDLDGEEKECTLKTVQQLLAVIYFNNSFEAAPFEVLNPVFSFLIGKMSPKELQTALENVEGFEDLQDIESDDYDDCAELRKAIIEVLASDLEASDIYVDLEDEELLLSFKEAVESITVLEDVANVTVSTCETNWGEFTNSYSERLNAYISNEEQSFTAIPSNAPNYNDAVAYWIDVMKKEVLMGDVPLFEGDLEDCVQKALASGIVRDLIPDTIQSIEDAKYPIFEE